MNGEGDMVTVGRPRQQVAEAAVCDDEIAESVRNISKVVPELLPGTGNDG